MVLFVSKLWFQDSSCQFKNWKLINSSLIYCSWDLIRVVMWFEYTKFRVLIYKNRAHSELKLKSKTKVSYIQISEVLFLISFSELIFLCHFIVNTIKAKTGKYHLPIYTWVDPDFEEPIRNDEVIIAGMPKDLN